MKSCTFFLLGQKAYQSLVNIPGHLLPMISYVVIGTDYSVVNDYSAEIKSYCINHNIRYSMRTEQQPVFSEYNFAIGWRWMIPVLQGNYLITFHDSLLPKYRGFNPLVTALINGDKEVGVTALYASENFDAGPVIQFKSLAIEYPIYIRDAIAAIANCYSDLLNDLLQLISSGNHPSAYQQDEAQASYSLWRDEEDYFIDWSDDASKIKRMIDAVGEPYLGARCLVNGEIIIINEAEVKDDIIVANRTAGKVIWKNAGNPVIVCGKGLLEVTKATKTDGTPFRVDRLRTRFK